MLTPVGTPINQNSSLVLPINGLFRLAAPQPVKSHKSYQQILDKNFVQNVTSSRPMIT